MIWLDSRLKNSKFLLKHAVYYRKYVYVPFGNYLLYKYQTVILFGRIGQRVQGGLFSCLVTDVSVQSFFINKLPSFRTQYLILSSLTVFTYSI